MNAQNELREYLGKKFESAWTVWTNERLQKELKGYADEWDFYRRSKYATYLLAHNIVNGWREPHLAFVRETAPACEVLEYYAGIGGFGLRLYDGYGYAPAFADYQTKSTPFLKWRLRQRNLKADLWDVEKDEISPYSLVVCFDALERCHSEQQADLIERLSQLGQTVVISADSRKLDISAILAQIGGRIMKHKVVNVYANLIAYRGG